MQKQLDEIQSDVRDIMELLVGKELDLDEHKGLVGKVRNHEVRIKKVEDKQKSHFSKLGIAALFGLGGGATGASTTKGAAIITKLLSLFQ